MIRKVEFNASVNVIAPTNLGKGEEMLCEWNHQASLRDAMRCGSRCPWVETHGYHQTSLREEGIGTATPRYLSPSLRFAAERHLMVARPFKAGIECP